MKLHPPAKINLGLRILAREQSGYHQLETLFCALDLRDELELTPSAAGLRLIVHGDDGTPAQNLVITAATHFYEEIALEPALDMRLRKHIPVGAGLGGGSSDAASTLIGLNALHGQPLRETDLQRLAIRLGSDVPFFLAGSPLALGWGRGERLLALPPLDPAPVLLAVPPFSVSTQEAFAAHAEGRAPGDPPAGSPIWRMDELSWDGIARRAKNDFESVIFPKHPMLLELRDALREAGARLALLTGTGSCVFGVFRDSAERDAVAWRLEQKFEGLRAIPAWTSSVSSGAVL